MTPKISPALLAKIAAGASLKTDTTVSDVCDIQIARITSNPHQPRIDIDPVELRALADSIRLHGLIQPVTAIRSEGGFILVSGHTRVEAHRVLGRESIRANIIEADLEDLAMLALIENVTRSDLHPLEIALALSHEPFVSMRDDHIAAALGLNVTKLRNIRSILRLSNNAQTFLRIHPKPIGVEILAEIQKLPERIHHDALLQYTKGGTRDDIRALVRYHTAHTTPKPTSPISRHGKTVKIDCSTVSDDMREDFESELHALITKYTKG